MTYDYSLRQVPQVTRKCVACEQEFTAHYARRICDACRPGAYRLCALANAKVRRAVKLGMLPDLSKVEIKCADCNWRASTWEHRDYAKPLEVEPICYGCNCRRGAAKRSAGPGNARPWPSILRRIAAMAPLKRRHQKGSGRM